MYDDDNDGDEKEDNDNEEDDEDNYEKRVILKNMKIMIYV